MRRLWLATALLAVSCGTTVHEPTSQVASSGDAGLAPPVVQQQTVPQTSAAATSAAPPESRTASPRTPGTRPTVTTAASSVAPAKQHRVANHDPIQIGFVTTSVGNAQSLGVNAGSSYSDQSMFSALVAEYNKHGGLDGHPIVPVYGATDTASSNWANQFQSVCAKFTQDNHVQAVIGYVFVFLPSFERCLANAHVAHLYGGYQPGDVVDQRQYPTLVSTANPTTDGAWLTVLDGASRSGLLAKGTKIGLLIDTCADGDRAYSRSVEPWLKAHGLSYQTVIGNCAQGSTDVSSAVTAVGNAELRFASSGVKVVLGSGPELLVFMEAAQTQGYQPQYLTAVGGAALEANAPTSQLKNLHGYGWLPAVDVDPDHQPAARTPQQKACLAMLVKHGLQAKQYNDFMTAYAACDGLDLYAKALAAGASTPIQVAQDVAAVESSFTGALTYDGKLRATSVQHGGPGVYRQYAWTAGCSCLTYQGPTYPIPSP
ncbi:MAG TPA: hypothetical protein VHC43_14430 [Mycobacteriales bacterium]|nr:hypothetical protein [Mycobacteriales bacterium]